jgi:threonine dehydrogenase-like Zn-dependent dehydrogenase
MVMGHEITGEIVEVGRDVEALRVGDLVSIPFNIACGGCCCRACHVLCEAYTRFLLWHCHRTLPELQGGTHGAVSQREPCACWRGVWLCRHGE